MDDWALGVKQVNPLAYYWTRVYVGLVFVAPAIAFYERSWPLPVPFLLGSVVALVGMLVVGARYDGIVKSMGMPHALGVGTAAAVTGKWVFADRLLVNDDADYPISFAWACVSVPFCALMTLVDVVDVIDWYVLRNRKVTRSRETIQGYIKKGRLPADTGNVQWLMKRGVVVNQSCDEYGFLSESR